jgi:hypothetical protein
VSEAPNIDRDDQVRNLLDMARERTENGHRHYSGVTTCKHGEELHVGWLELSQEAQNAQHILDFFGIPGGDPQGRGDVDWRVAEAGLRLHAAEGALAAIKEAHARETGPAGTVGDFCIECEQRWPCPTYAWANGERSVIDCWDPAADEPSNGSSGGAS